MKKLRNDNREGSTRKLTDGKWECVIQSKYINPKTGKPKRIKRKGETEKEARKRAKEELIRWETGIENGSDSKVDKKKTFGQYMDDFVESEVKKGLTDSGYHSYIRTLRCNFYNYPISKLQLHMLNKVVFQQFYDSLQKDKSHRTALFPRQICIRCNRWLVNQKLVAENYAEQAILTREIADEYDRKIEEERKHRKEIFSSEDIVKLYNAYKNNIGEYAVVAMFLLETGMRVSEFASLRNSNIHLDTGRIDIVETRAIRFIDNNPNNGIEEYVKVPKNKEARFVMMSDLCKECVLYMQEQTKIRCKSNPDDLLYPSFRSGKRRTVSSMEKCFKTLCDNIKIDRDVHMTKAGSKMIRKGLSLHALRHTADSIANAAKDANVVNTALAMGHKAISTENVYTHATEEGLSNITTPSQAVIEKYKKDNGNSQLSEIEELKAEIEILKHMIGK